MKKIVRLTETDLTKLIKRVINEQVPSGMGTQKSYTRQPMSSKITINEFKKIVKRILKENIDYPKLDFSKKDSEGYVDRYELDYKMEKIERNIVEYIKNNIKIYNYETNSYELPKPSKVQIHRDFTAIEPHQGVRYIELVIYGEMIFLTIEIFFTELRTNVEFRVSDSEYGIEKYGQPQPIFETEKDLDLILEVLKKYVENYMNKNLNIKSLKEEIKSKDPNNLLFKNSRNLDSQDKTKISSSEFRRGGEMSFGKSGDFKAEKKFDRRGGEINIGQKSGDYKGKFTK